MFNIQIISLIVFVISIVAIPVIDKLFFYNAFALKGDLKGTGEKEQSEYKEKVTSGILEKESSTETREMPMNEEDLEAKKLVVKKSDARLQSRIIESDPVGEANRLRDERINIEKNTVDRPATEADFKNFQERNREMVERVEIPIGSKESRVVEEVRIEKNIEERNETVKDTVSKTEVNAEKPKRMI